MYPPYSKNKVVSLGGATTLPEADIKVKYPWLPWVVDCGFDKTGPTPVCTVFEFQSLHNSDLPRTVLTALMDKTKQLWNDVTVVPHGNPETLPDTHPFLTLANRSNPPESPGEQGAFLHYWVPGNAKPNTEVEDYIRQYPQSAHDISGFDHTGLKEICRNKSLEREAIRRFAPKLNPRHYRVLSFSEILSTGLEALRNEFGNPFLVKALRLSVGLGVFLVNKDTTIEDLTQQIERISPIFLALTDDTKFVVESFHPDYHSYKEQTHCKNTRVYGITYTTPNGPETEIIGCEEWLSPHPIEAETEIRPEQAKCHASAFGDVVDISETTRLTPVQARFLHGFFHPLFGQLLTHYQLKT